MFRNKEKGQSLVEATFGLIVFLIIMGGLIDIGRWYFQYTAMEDAAGDAALYFSAFPGDEAEAINRATAFNGGILSDLDNSTVTLSCYELETKDPLDCETEATAMDVVKVDVYYDFELLGSVIPEIAGGYSIRLHSTATQIIVSNN